LTVPRLPASVSEDTVDQAVQRLRWAHAIVYPTETLYGLGVDATSLGALERLADLKGGDRDKPVSVLVASRAMLDDFVADVPAVAERLIEKFWPGALTIALTARSTVPARLTAGTGTIGARVSSHPVAQAIVTALGRPLTATSANPGGAPPPGEVATARGYFSERVAVYVDAGPAAGSPASTVLDCSTPTPRLVRAGAIPLEAIEAAAGMRVRRE
jgi:L-threonylcarbamoyladenylate synthase